MSSVKGFCRVELISKADGKVTASVESPNTITNAFLASRFVNFLNHTAASTQFLGLTTTQPDNGLGMTISSPSSMGVYVMQSAANIVPETVAAPYLPTATGTAKTVVEADFDDGTSPGVLWYCCGNGTAGTAPTGNFFVDTATAGSLATQQAQPRLLAKHSSMWAIEQNPTGWTVKTVWERDPGYGTVRAIVFGGDTPSQKYGIASVHPGAASAVSACPAGVVMCGVDLPSPIVKDEDSVLRLTYTWTGSWT